MAHRLARKHVVHEVGGGLRHSAGMTRGANAAPFTGKSDEELMATVRAPGAGKPVGQDAALEILAKIALDEARDPLSARISG